MQPVLASGVVLVLVLSRLMLRERLSSGEAWCVAAIALSVVLLALSAAGSAANAGHYASPGWMTAVIGLSVVVGILVAGSSLRACSALHGAQTGVCFASAPGCSTVKGLR